MGKESSGSSGGIQVTPELLARYDRPGPRYTSYPTAVEFHEELTLADYHQCLEEANRHTDDPFSVYVHLPFCDHRCLFCGCHVIISPHKEKAKPYLTLLEKEIDLLAARVSDRRKLSQLHLGGGTPTYYRPDQLAHLLERLLDVFEPTSNAELAVEVDPRVTSPEHIDTLADFGFNRMSLGVQDFTPKVQEAVERVQSIEQTAGLVEHARKRGYGGINIDLIYGLPFQTPETFEETVKTVIDIGADRAAVYSFAFVPWMRAHMKKLGDDVLPDRDTKFDLFCRARDAFLAAGYEAIGMDHFARPDDELAIAKKEGRLRRNFQGYSVIPANDVLGLGISAIGDLRGAYIQSHKKLSDYKTQVEEGNLPLERGILRTKDDEIRRDVIHELMCNFRVEIPEVEAAHGIEFEAYFKEDLELLVEHEKEGLVERSKSRILATPLGEAFIRNVAMCFDWYWREKHAGQDKQTFSRTV